MNSNILQDYALITKNLKDIFCFDLQQLSIDLQKYLIILETSNSEFKTQVANQLDQINLKDNKIQDLLQQQNEAFVKIQKLEDLNSYLGLQLVAESQNRKNILKTLTIQEQNNKQMLVQMNEESQIIQFLYQRGKLQQKIYKHNYLQVCDYKLFMSKCPSLYKNYKEGFGAYSHYEPGLIYATDTYGQGSIKCFSFKIDDIIELQWNGPFRTFTTENLTTGEKFELKVKFNVDAEIHFSVCCYNKSSFEII